MTKQAEQTEAETSKELALLSGATKMLAEVHDAASAWHLAATAEAARRYAKMRDLGTEASNYALGIKAKALVLLADFVDQGQESGTVRRPGERSNVVERNVSPPAPIGDLLGMDSPKARQVVRQARVVRDALAGVDVDELLAEATEEGEDLAMMGLLRRADEQRRLEASPSEPPIIPSRTHKSQEERVKEAAARIAAELATLLYNDTEKVGHIWLGYYLRQRCLDLRTLRFYASSAADLFFKLAAFVEAPGFKFDEDKTPA